jgi:hypothetical protein
MNSGDTFVLLEGIDVVVGLCVQPEDRARRLDGALPGESAYGSPGGVTHGS